MSLKKNVISGLFWTGGTRFVLQVITWAITIIVMRLLSPKDYGLMELALVFINFFSMINEMGLGAAIVQRRDVDESQLKTIFGFILIVSVLFSIILSCFAPSLSSFYNEPQLVPVLLYLSMTFVFSGFCVVPYSLLLRDQKFKLIALIDFIAGLIGSLVTVILAIQGQGVWSLVIGMLAIRIVTVVGCQWFQPYFCMPKFNCSGMGDIFKFSGHVVLARVLWFFYTSAAASLVIGKVLGSELLGLYGVGLYLACLPMEKVGGIINQVAFPAFSSIQNDPNLARIHLLKVIRILGIVSIPVFWGMSSVAHEIIHIFLGLKWESAAFPFQIIALIVPLRMIRNIFMPALLGIGKSDVNLYMEIVAVILLPLSFYIGTFWSISGVSFAWLLMFPIVFFINFRQIIHVFNVNIIDLVKILYKSALSGAMMYLSVYLLHLYLNINVSEVVQFLIMAFVGAFVYISMSFVINKEGVLEIINLVKK